MKGKGKRTLESIKGLIQGSKNTLKNFMKIIGKNNPSHPTTEDHQSQSKKLKMHLGKTKTGKFLGLDEIPTEAIKALDEFGFEKLSNLVNKIYHTGHLPDDMLQNVFVTLPKKPKVIDCGGDFRTISLMSHTTKILLRIILERMKWKINSEIGEEQFGFAQKAEQEMGFLLLTCSRKIPGSTERHLRMLNRLCKAFDKVRHSQMIECLEKLEQMAKISD